MRSRSGLLLTPGMPLVVATVALGGVQVVLLAHVAEAPLWTSYLYAPVGLLFVLAGVAAMTRRPTNRLGTLLALAGLVGLLANFAAIPYTATVVVGSLTVTAVLGMVTHLLHAFPSGRLTGRPERVAVAATYVLTLVLVAPAVYLLNPDSPLGIADAPGVADAFDTANSWIYVVLTAASAVILARRLRHLSPERRRTTGPLYLYGILALLMVSFAPNVLPRLVDTPFTTVELLQLLAVAGVPIAFVETMVRGGYLRSASASEVTARLATGVNPTREALAAALGDPSVVLHDGVPDAVGRDRGLLPIAADGRSLGAIEYDATIMTDPAALNAAGTMVAVSQERDRLNAQLRDASERMVSAADRERARIARDLHDGLQARLVLLALRADARAPHLRDELNEVIDDLRAFVQGVMPAGLIEQGLEAAVEDLADRLPMACEVRIAVGEERLPPAVESTAYFVVAEAVANAVKHAGASRLEVDVSRRAQTLLVQVADDGTGGARAGGGGIGLSGLNDRLDALGGVLRIESTAGAGTRIEAVVPCGS